MRGAEGGGGMVEKINKILKISAVGEVFRLRNARSLTDGLRKYENYTL